MAIGRVNTGGGGTGGTLTVTGIAGHTVTATKDGKTYTRTFNSNGVAVFKGLSTGTWTLTMTGDGQTATRTVDVSADYAVTITYFSATISVTYPAGSTCTCTDGTTILTDTNTDTSAKTVTFTVLNTGTWTITVTDGDKRKDIAVEITTDGQSESVTLSYELVAFLNGVTDPAVGGWTGGTITSNVLRFNPGGGSSGSVRSNNELDLRGFTKITFHVKNLDSQDNSSSKVGISSTNANNSSFITSATMPTGGGAWSTSDVTKVIDITSVDSGYIKIYGSSSNSTAMLKLDIDKILLE